MFWANIWLFGNNVIYVSRALALSNMTHISHADIGFGFADKLNWRVSQS